MAVTADIGAPALRLGPGAITALAILLAGAVPTVLAPYLPWLAVWPLEWTLPVKDWIGAGLTWFLELIKPAARLVSAGLSLPMSGATWALSG